MRAPGDGTLVREAGQRLAADVDRAQLLERQVGDPGPDEVAARSGRHFCGSSTGVVPDDDLAVGGEPDVELDPGHARRRRRPRSWRACSRRRAPWRRDGPRRRTGRRPRDRGVRGISGLDPLAGRGVEEVHLATVGLDVHDVTDRQVGALVEADRDAVGALVGADRAAVDERLRARATRRARR